MTMAGSLAGSVGAGLGGGGVLTPLQVAAARLHWWHEVGLSPQQLDGSGNASQLNDLGSYGYHVSQGTAANRPHYHATGGPRADLPYLAPNDANDLLDNTAISLSAGRRLTFFAVVAMGAVDTRVILAARTAGLDGVHQLYRGVGVFSGACKQQGVAEQTVNATAPALHTGWAIHMLDYGAAGTEWQIAGATVATDFTGTAAADAVELLTVGHASLADGRFYAWLCCEDLTAVERASVVAYLRVRTGLAWA